MSEKRGKWTKLSSELVHKNPYYSVRQDSVIKPDGSEGFYNVVEGKGAVFIVALDDNQEVLLIELHRYTNNNISIEVPAGGIDENDPLDAAKRELQEEAGVVAENWKQLGVIHPANGILSEKNYVYLATKLSAAKQNEQKEEGITKAIRVPLDKAFQMIKAGKITDTESIATLTLAALELGMV